MFCDEQIDLWSRWVLFGTLFTYLPTVCFLVVSSVLCCLHQGSPHVFHVGKLPAILACLEFVSVPVQESFLQFSHTVPVKLKLSFLLKIAGNRSPGFSFAYKQPPRKHMFSCGFPFWCQNVPVKYGFPKYRPKYCTPVQKNDCRVRFPLACPAYRWSPQRSPRTPHDADVRGLELCCPPCHSACDVVPLPWVP